MKVLLVRPPNRYYLVPASDIPLGLLYLAGSLRQAGHDVRIYDAMVDPELVNGRRTDSAQAGPDSQWEGLRRELDRTRPNVVGITSRFTAQMESAIAAAEVVKKVDPAILTVVGGNHASISPDSFFEESGAIDVVCQGEGEEAIVEIAGCLDGAGTLDTIRGIAFRKESQVIVNERRPFNTNLDGLPLPAYDLIDMEQYFSAVKQGLSGRAIYSYAGSERAISMVTSRGCPYQCVFCSIHMHMGRNWRWHSAEYVLDHLEHLVSKYKIKHIHFEDDNLTLNERRFEQILDGIIARRLNITWDTPNGVRADRLTKELLIKCKKAGCIYLFVGVESGVQRVLDQVVRKKLDLNAVRRVAAWCHEIGLDLGGFFVIGFPGEAKEEMKGTLEFALEMEKSFRVYPVVMLAMPLIGTELHRICVENGFLDATPTPQNLARAIDGLGLIRTEVFSPQEVTDIRDAFYRQHKSLFMKEFISFGLRHPQAVLRFVRNTLSPGMGDIKFKVFTNMFLKNCLIRDLGKC